MFWGFLKQKDCHPSLFWKTFVNDFLSNVFFHSMYERSKIPRKIKQLVQNVPSVLQSLFFLSQTFFIEKFGVSKYFLDSYHLFWTKIDFCGTFKKKHGENQILRVPGKIRKPPLTGFSKFFCFLHFLISIKSKFNEFSKRNKMTSDKNLHLKKKFGKFFKIIK